MLNKEKNKTKDNLNFLYFSSFLDKIIKIKQQMIIKNIKEIK